MDEGSSVTVFWWMLGSRKVGDMIFGGLFNRPGGGKGDAVIPGDCVCNASLRPTACRLFDSRTVEDTTVGGPRGVRVGKEGESTTMEIVCEDGVILAVLVWDFGASVIPGVRGGVSMTPGVLAGR